MFKEIVLKFKTRSILVIILSLGATFLAINDTNFRNAYGNIVSLGVGGYLGQLNPTKKEGEINNSKEEEK